MISFIGALIILIISEKYLICLILLGDIIEVVGDIAKPKRNNKKINTKGVASIIGYVNNNLLKDFKIKYMDNPTIEVFEKEINIPIKNNIKKNFLNLTLIISSLISIVEITKYGTTRPGSQLKPDDL